MTARTRITPADQQRLAMLVEDVARIAGVLPREAVTEPVRDLLRARARTDIVQMDDGTYSFLPPDPSGPPRPRHPDHPATT